MFSFFGPQSLFEFGAEFGPQVPMDADWWMACPSRWVSVRPGQAWTDWSLLQLDPRSDHTIPDAPRFAHFFQSRQAGSREAPAKTLGSRANEQTQLEPLDTAGAAVLLGDKDETAAAHAGCGQPGLRT